MVIAVIAFEGNPIAFQGFVEISMFEIQHEAKIHSQTGSEIDQFPFMCIHVPSFSLHSPFIFIPMCIHVLSCSVHVHAFPFNFAFLSFHFLSFPFQSYGNGSMAWPGDRVQQMVIANLSLRLSPNTVIPPTYDIVRRNFATKTRERERERVRKKERERVGCQMIW